ncbi:Rieske (2Fe-2S) protein [Arcanobacterium canis]
MTDLVVCKVGDVALGDVDAFTVETGNGKHVFAVVHSESDHWFTMDNRCSHGRFKISEGFVEDETIECTRHGSVFELPSGQALNPPASAPIKTYPTRTEGDDVVIDF